MLEYSVVVIAAVMVLTWIALIVTLFYVIRLIKSVQRLTEEARPHIAPISHDITIITQKTARILESVQRQTFMIEESVDNVRQISRNVKDFEANLLAKIALPAVKLSQLGQGIKRGFDVVYNRFTHHRKRSL
ncbi:MAG TPA: DUF948 domain-containing protein [bacterium]|nr:DUF948 domain-containing protein [bacterium]HOH06069.1 DUF948 domain-containing protein [bacterium]HOY44668.1 DUF948 domain-containing protein [bacterium]HPG81759.1 DUF948 domain-containing protein [bacterium]HPM58070.1 DUF948 domain-containing protein [bacterium]